MINVSEEKAKVAKMKQTITDINNDTTKLCNSMKNTSSIFQGDKVSDSINELVEHSTKISNEASNLENQISGINGVIDQVYQEPFHILFCNGSYLFLF